MTDARTQLLSLLARHKAAGEGFERLVTFLASDQSAGFFAAPFHQRRDSRFAAPGSLYQATIEGYKALLFLHRTATEIYTPTDIDRLVMCFVLIMVSRWADLKTGRLMYTDTATAPHASMATLTVVNAMSLSIELSAPETQAVLKHFASYSEMGTAFEPFNTEWWIIHQTMDFILVASRA